MNEKPPPLLRSDIDYNPPPPPLNRGDSTKSWVIGCSAGCLVAALIVGVAGFFVARSLVSTWNEAREKLTSTEPVQFETPSAAGGQDLQGVLNRYNRFREALASRTDAEPLVLTGDDVNVLICFHPDLAALREHARVSIEDDKLTSRLSIPLDGMMESMKGRFLNGEATIRLSLAGGKLHAYIENLQAAGYSVPEPFMRELRKEDVFEDSRTDPEFDALINTLDKIEIEGGKLHIVPKPANERPPAAGN